jgi:hypothetical protein
MGSALASRWAAAGGDWPVLRTLLPPHWAALGWETGAFVRAARLEALDEERWLQLLLSHAVTGRSLTTTMFEAALAGAPSSCHMGLDHKLRRCAPWIAALHAALPPLPCSPLAGWKRPVLVVDGTVLTVRGSHGADFRIHGCYSVADQAWVESHLTTGHEGERLARFHFPAGALVLADRGYASAASLRTLHAQRVDGILRWKSTAGGLRTPAGDPLPVRDWLATLGPGESGEWRGVVPPETEGARPIPVRLVALPLPATQVAQAQRKLGRYAR